MNRDKRRRIAYHEAGHAIAAQILGGYVTKMDISPTGDAHTWHHDPADLAFIAWAGSWAENHHLGGDCTADGLMAFMREFNSFDWLAYHNAQGCNYSNDDRFDAELCAELCRGPRVAEIAPQDGWDRDLAEARHEIEDLAERLADGEDVIELVNGQRLFRVWPDWWLRTPFVH
jgi:hypothetical protein